MAEGVDRFLPEGERRASGRVPTGRGGYFRDSFILLETVDSSAAGQLVLVARSRDPRTTAPSHRAPRRRVAGGSRVPCALSHRRRSSSSWPSAQPPTERVAPCAGGYPRSAAKPNPRSTETPRGSDVGRAVVPSRPRGD